MHPDRTAEDGFTLLEVIIAFAISALAVSLLYQGVTGGLGATQIAGKTTGDRAAGEQRRGRRRL
jgi:prepilin-type N-terminal cleavage/methylation domain-containing protein